MVLGEDRVVLSNGFGASSPFRMFTNTAITDDENDRMRFYYRFLAGLP